MADAKSSPSIQESGEVTWQDIVKRLQVPSNKRAIWQVANTVVPYLLLWVAMYFTKEISILLTLGIACVAGLFLVRTFILFHDCGHNSFFDSRRANTIVGFCLGALAFVSFHHWQWEHWRHHATAGDLDRRGVGDVWTMTIAEYASAPWWKRILYRLSRNPFLMLTIGPPLLFLVWQRLPNKECTPLARKSVYWLNVVLLAAVVLMCLVFGTGAYLLIQLAVMCVAGMVGVWMFYVQHQFEGVYWQRADDWTAQDAALQGSSYYALPAVLRWFTGNIGFHHVHHLGPRIPNYYLKRCHESHPAFQKVPTLTIWSSLKCCSLHLWDEESRRLVGYRHAKRLLRGRRQSTSSDAA